MKTETFENDHFRIWFDRGILWGEYKSEVLDLPAARACVDLRLEASGGRSYPAFFNAKGVKSINKEARDYFSSDEGYRGLKATALLVESAVGKFLVNFFLKINHPPVPLKLFTNEEEGVQWLKQFMDEEEEARE